jgi:hypothetical protein
MILSNIDKERLFQSFKLNRVVEAKISVPPMLAAIQNLGN